MRAIVATVVSSGHSRLGQRADEGGKGRVPWRARLGE